MLASTSTKIGGLSDVERISIRLIPGAAAAWVLDHVSGVFTTPPEFVDPSKVPFDSRKECVVVWKNCHTDHHSRNMRELVLSMAAV